jgi:hypothetical protein
MGYGITIWNTAYRYGHLPYRYSHPGDRNGIWPNDMGDDSIDMVISHIDMGYLVALSMALRMGRLRASEREPGRQLPAAGSASRRCSPRHPATFEPSLLDLNGIL